jgi:protein transport protein SEC24
MGAPNVQSGAYRQQQVEADEQPKAHFVTLTRASSTSSRIMNHETIPRPTVDGDRSSEGTTHYPERSRTAPYIVPCASDYVRLTTPVIPSTPQLADKFSLPLAYTVSPLAPGPAVPVVNLAELPNGGCGIVRCRRCRAYVNPYCPFIDGGRRWQCSVCRGLNDTPQPYFCQLDPQNNVRYDVLQRPELCHAVVDFVAPLDYMTRPPQRPSFVFCLDLSYNAAQTGMLRSACTGVIDALFKIKEAAEADGATDDAVEAFESLQIGFVGFDSVIYLFNLRSGLSAPKLIVAPDLAADVAEINEKTGIQVSLELPALHEDLLVSAKDSFDLIMTLMDKLPVMFGSNANAEAAFGPAIQTAITLLNPTGGKIVSLLAGCPSMGEGRLRSREDPKLFHTPKENTLTHPATEWYKQRALACSNAHISCDLIVIASQSVDLASLVPLARYTGGHVLQATNTNRAVLHRDVTRCLTRTFGFEAVFRIRNPPQLGTINFFGHFYVRGNDMLALPVSDSDSAYTIQFNLQTSLSGTLYAQTALLYTSQARERRIRVFTFPIETTASLARVYNQANPYAMAVVLCKSAVDHSVSNTFQACVSNTNDRLVKSLRTFKAMIPGAGRPTNTLILPAALKLLPSFINGYQRCPATRFSTVLDTPPDVRVANMSLIAHLNVDSVIAAISPSIHCVYSKRGDLKALPRPEIVSIEAMKHDSIYLVDLPGALRVLWYGRGVDAAALEAFGIPTPSAMSPAASPAESRLMDELGGGGDDDEEQLLRGCVERYEGLVRRLDRLARGLPQVALHHVAQGSSASNPHPQGMSSSGSNMSNSLPSNPNTSFSQPISPTGTKRVVTERTLIPRMLEEDAKEAVSYTGYLAFLQRRANSAD